NRGLVRWLKTLYIQDARQKKARQSRKPGRHYAGIEERDEGRRRRAAYKRRVADLAARFAQRPAWPDAFRQDESYAADGGARRADVRLDLVRWPRRHRH